VIATGGHVLEEHLMAAFPGSENCAPGSILEALAGAADGESPESPMVTKAEAR
jgi:hypothetical protein